MMVRSPVKGKKRDLKKLSKIGSKDLEKKSPLGGYSLQKKLEDLK